MVKPLTYGRMGNFLFQAATAMGYAWRHDLDYTLPSYTKNPRTNPIYLQHLVNKRWKEHLPKVTITEGTHAYQELPFQESWRKQNIILDGYWQTEKYFKEFRPRILTAFAFPYQFYKGFVSVHVRRTDYLRLTQKHPQISKAWIEVAMSMFPDHQFVFFSDDIPWCRHVFGHRKDATFSEGKDEVNDLVNMSWCEHNICSASTFSWWGAWLNQNPLKRVIMPRLWFMPGYGGLDTSDIVPMEWQKL